MQANDQLPGCVLVNKIVQELGLLQLIDMPLLERVKLHYRIGQQKEVKKKKHDIHTKFTLQKWFYSLSTLPCRCRVA